MWDLLPENPGFGAQFARNFGRGASQGVEQAQQAKYTQAENLRKQENAKELVQLKGEQKILLEKVKIESELRSLQQKRLQADLDRKAYDGAIKNIDEEIKNAGFNSKLKEELNARRKNLSKARDALLGITEFNDESIKGLENKLYNIEKPSKKIKWNPNNPDHQKDLQAFKKKFNNSEDEINAALFEKYDI